MGEDPLNGLGAKKHLVWLGCDSWCTFSILTVQCTDLKKEGGKVSQANVFGTSKSLNACFSKKILRFAVSYVIMLNTGLILKKIEN